MAHSGRATLGDVPLALTDVCFSGKADMTRTGRVCPLMTQSGHCVTRQEPEAVLCRVIPGHTALKGDVVYSRRWASILDSWMALGLLSVPLTSELMSFAAADEMRRRYGRALDLWLARTETPSRLVLEPSGVKLREWGGGKSPAEADHPGANQEIVHLGPDALSQPMWAYLEAGFRVYVLEWKETPPDHPNNGLPVYVDELILECAKSIGEPAILAGHSLGGTFATIFASLERVRALILLEAPLSFAGDPGAIAERIRIGPATEFRKVSAYPGTVLDA